MFLLAKFKLYIQDGALAASPSGGIDGALKLEIQVYNETVAVSCEPVGTWTRIVSVEMM